MRKITFMLLYLILFGSSTRAIEPARFTRMNQVIAEKHIIPRYQKLAEKTKKLDSVALRFCSAPGPELLAEIQGSFHEAADSWAGIQHIQFGPIEEKLRLARVFFWPDKHNTGSRHLVRLLKSKDEKMLNPERFSTVSVALQGLPAMERVLFVQQEMLFDDSENARFRCQLIKAISGNLRNIAAQVLQEWNDENEGFLRIATSTGVPYYTGEDEVFQDHLASLYGGIRAVHDLKLKRPLGETPEQSRPRRAEAWRSDRSLRNIIINLEAAQELYRGADGFGMDDFITMLNPESKTAQDFESYLNHTLTTARGIKLPLHKAVLDVQQHDQVSRLQAQVFALIGFIRGRLSTAVGMGTGFNFLDGD